MNTNLVKLRFLKGGEPQGREYTYISKAKVGTGRMARITGNTSAWITK